MNTAEINEKGVYQHKETKPLSQLSQGEKFQIVDLKIIKTRYGETVLVECTDFKVFLPKRATEVIKRNIYSFQQDKYFLVFDGIANGASNFRILEN